MSAEGDYKSLWQSLLYSVMTLLQQSTDISNIESSLTPDLWASVSQSTLGQLGLTKDNLIAIVKSYQEAMKKFGGGLLVPPATAGVVNIEAGDQSQPTRDNPLLSLPTDLYKEMFLPVDHINFVGKDGADDAVFSCELPRDQPKLRCLRTNKYGSKLITLDYEGLGVGPVPPDGALSNSKYLSKLTKALTSELKGHSKSGESKYWPVWADDFPEEFAKIEANHRQDNKRCMKLAVVYSKRGQKTAPEMFANTPDDVSSRFHHFLGQLADKIDLSTHDGYMGDLNAASGTSFFKRWNGLEVMYHVAPFMNSEQHRRLIGNDICIIFFHDSPTPFETNYLETFGQVPQVYAVVQPQENPPAYKLAFLSRTLVQQVEPLLGSKTVFPMDQGVDWLLIKLANTYIEALRCPPLNRLFFVPRGAALEDLLSKYPEKATRKPSGRPRLAHQGSDLSPAPGRNSVGSGLSARGHARVLSDDRTDDTPPPESKAAKMLGLAPSPRPEQVDHVKAIPWLAALCAALEPHLAQPDLFKNDTPETQADAALTILRSGGALPPDYHVLGKMLLRFFESVEPLVPKKFSLQMQEATSAATQAANVMLERILVDCGQGRRLLELVLGTLHRASAHTADRTELGRLFGPAVFAQLRSPEKICQYFIDNFPVLFASQALKTVLDLQHKISYGDKSEGYCTSACAVSADRVWIAFSGDGRVAVFDTKTYKRLNEFKLPTEKRIYTLILIGNLVWCAGDDGLIWMVQPATYQIGMTLDEHKGNMIKSLTASSDGKQVISGDIQGKVVRWASNGVRQYTGNLGFPIIALARSDDFLYVGTDRSIVALNANTLQPDHQWDAQGGKSAVDRLVVVGGHVVSATSAGAINVWDGATGNLVRKLEAHNGRIESLTVLNGFLFSGSFDKSLLVWDLASWSVVQKLLDYCEDGINNLVPLFENQTMWSLSRDRILCCWRFEEVRPPGPPPKSAGVVSPTIRSPPSTTVITAKKLPPRDPSAGKLAVGPATGQPAGLNVPVKGVKVMMPPGKGVAPKKIPARPLSGSQDQDF